MVRGTPRNPPTKKKKGFITCDLKVRRLLGEDDGKPGGRRSQCRILPWRSTTFTTNRWRRFIDGWQLPVIYCMGQNPPLFGRIELAREVHLSSSLNFDSGSGAIFSLFSVNRLGFTAFISFGEFDFIHSTFEFVSWFRFFEWSSPQSIIFNPAAGVSSAGGLI